MTAGDFLPYCRDLNDPHGLCEICRDCDQAFPCAWDALWRWEDGSPVVGVYYFNIAKARRAAARNGMFKSFDTNDRLEAGERMLGSYWRVPSRGERA
jgi:hypothetical protein